MNARLAVGMLLLIGSATSAWADVTISFGAGSNRFDMDFVTIGHAGNPADTTGVPNPVGSVGYVYLMGKYEVSRDMVIRANASGGLAITLDSMSFMTGGPRGDIPATGITWNEAARFVNWLNTSQGYQPAYRFEMQPGETGYLANAKMLLWPPSDPGYSAVNPFRNSQAQYFLPSVDEWYKAAYYDPNVGGGAGGYWDYAIGSDLMPTAVSGGTASGSAVWGQSTEQGPADVDQAGGLSPYGVMGMNGNVWELEETERDLVNDTSPSFRGVRGGAWFNGDNSLSVSNRVFHDPADGVSSIGFRVASIPMFACGDFDTDLDVDSSDLVEFLTAWTGEGGTGATPGRGDCDADGDVDSADLVGFLTDWTGSAGAGRVELQLGFASPARAEPLPLTVVPEPGSVVLLLAGLARFGLRWRRR